MSTTGTMRGKRLPDAKMGEGGPGWSAFYGEGHKLIAAPGSYMLVTTEGTLRYLYLVDPTGHQGTVVSNKHTITEEPDGTITVSPSILATEDEHGHDFHGFLQHGEWNW